MADRRRVAEGDDGQHTYTCGGCGRTVKQDPPEPGDPHPLAECIAGKHQKPAPGYPLPEWQGSTA